MQAINTIEPKIDVTFYIPCLNEEENISATLDTIFTAIKPFPFRFEIIVVDDGSEDRTLKILKQRIPNAPIPIRIIQNDETRGLGYNYFAASFQAKGEYYMLVNGDNAEPIDTLQAILSQKGKADMVIPYFGRNDQRTVARRTISAIFTGIINVITFRRIHYYNGPVLHRTENIWFYHAESAGYGYQAELICKLLNAGKSYIHVLVKNSDRERGFSKAFSSRNFLSVSYSLFNIFVRQSVQILYVLLGYRKQSGKTRRRTVLNNGQN